MYFSKIEIKNYGCIKKFEYQFRFDSNGNPIPCVLIGENGKGKTLVLANLVDSLVEFKRSVYGDNLQETSENKYFKIGSQNYINSNATFSRVMVEMTCGGQRSRLIDIMSKNPEQDISQFQTSEIQSVEDFKTDGFSKKTDCKLKRKDFTDHISLYFPVDRYYYPMWFNRGNQGLYHTEEITDIHSSKSNLIKTNLLKEIKEWLTEIFLDKTVQQLHINNDESIPEMLRGKTVLIPQENAMQRVVSNIFSVVKGVSVNSPTGISRKSKMLSFSSSVSFCNDVSQLSDGEMNLICIALAIVKEWDTNHNAENLSEITGTVIIDEVDSGLHIDYAYRALPQLMKLFPKVQFILTSHSPFFLSGLVKEYGENVDILTMPDGLKITDLSTFGEMKKAQDLFVESVEELRRKQELLTKELADIKAKKGKVLIYTEGETDVILLEKALLKLGITDLEVEFITASTKDGKHSDSVLKTLLENLQSNGDVQDNIVIGMFDRDAKDPIKFKCEDGVDRVVNNETFVKLGSKLYAFAIPVPHNRPEANQISIEHYFTDNEIKTLTDSGQRLFMANEFYKSGNHVDPEQHYNYRFISKLYGTIKIIEHQTNDYVTDLEGNGDYSLSKSRFANNVKDDIKGFDNFDFSEFNKIFDIIRSVLTGEGVLPCKKQES